MTESKKNNYTFSSRTAIYVVVFTFVILSPIILNLTLDIIHLYSDTPESVTAVKKVNSVGEFELLIESFMSTIEMYRNSIYSVFGLFALFGISSVVINWTGSNKLSEMQRDLDKARDELKEAVELKEKYQGYVADIEEKLEKIGRIEASVNSIDNNIKNELNDAKDIFAFAKAETERIRNLKNTARKDRQEIAITARRFKELLKDVQSIPDKADRLREARIEKTEAGIVIPAGSEVMLDDEIDQYLKDLESIEYAKEEEIESAIEITKNERHFNKLFFDAINARDNGKIDDFENIIAEIIKLTNIHSDNTRWKQHLGILYSFLGDLLLSHRFIERAYDAFEKCKNIAERLVAIDADNLDWERELGVACYRLAQVEMLRERYTDSEDYCDKSIAILSKLNKEKIFDVFIASCLVRSYNARVELFFTLERYQEAKNDLTNALVLIEELTGKDTENTYYMNDYARTCYYYVKYYKESDPDKTDAIMYYANKGYELFEYLQKRDIYFYVDNPEKMEYLKKVLLCD